MTIPSEKALMKKKRSGLDQSQGEGLDEKKGSGLDQSQGGGRCPKGEHKS